jgi:hypothetical protein
MIMGNAGAKLWLAQVVDISEEDVTFGVHALRTLPVCGRSAIFLKKDGEAASECFRSMAAE